MAKTQWKIAGAIVALVVSAALLWAVAPSSRVSVAQAYSAPGLDPMAAESARDRLFELVPSLLLVVYDGFAKTDEAEIYDTLAQAAGAEALETLYLERAGAMVGGGLTETDQTIHEMRLINATSRRQGETFIVDARWEVIGTVGHSEHMHVRGNTYSADLTIEPVDGAWKITAFDLTDVSRQAAGETFEADPDD